jgi:CYTH domain-containing protein
MDQDFDPAIAKALGFPRPQYTAVERERRWLCREFPRDQIRKTYAIVDVYVTDTRLRLREMRPVDGGPSQLRLSRKADVDDQTRLITSIYLPEAEFAILAASLVGPRITKIRHRLTSPPGVLLSIDEFQGQLAGLMLVEAELETAEALAAFPPPPFALREVTRQLEYTGGWLAKHGLPSKR